MTCEHDVPPFDITESFEDTTVCTCVLVGFGPVIVRSESIVVAGNFQYVELAVNVLYVVLLELSRVFGISISRDAIVLLPVGLSEVKSEMAFGDDVVVASLRTRVVAVRLFEKPVVIDTERDVVISLTLVPVVGIDIRPLPLKTLLVV